VRSEGARIVRHVTDFRISLASLKSPLQGSSVRENAVAPACPGLRDSASMLDLARHIVEQKTGSFEPDKFEDQYEPLWSI